MSAINPFTSRRVKKSSAIYKSLEEKGWIQESYRTSSSLNRKISQTTKRISLKTHQERVVEHFKKHRGLIAVHSVGSGKTITSIAASLDYLKESTKDRTVFVLCPASLEYNFRRELMTYIPIEDSAVIDKYNIMSFDKFSRHSEEYMELRNFFLIVDEAHNLRTQITKTSGIKARRILDFAAKADKVLLLTATPFYNDPYDIVNLISMISPRRAFVDRKYFVDALDRPNAVEFFHRYFRDLISVYIPDSAYLSEYYPTYNVNQVFLKMNKDYLNIYRLLESNADIVSDYYTNPNIFYSGLRQASNKLDNEMISPKIEWVRDFLKLHEGEKTLIFSNWIEAGVRFLTEFIPASNLVVIEGKTTKSQRKEAVEEYNSNPDKNIMLITRAGGEGLDLKGTRNVIILDPSWNSAVDDQVTGRAIRYMSHSHLPPEERHVEIYQLFLLKPFEYNREMGIETSFYTIKGRYQERSSVDLYLKRLAEKKDKYLKRFMQKMVLPVAIEAN